MEVARSGCQNGSFTKTSFNTDPVQAVATVRACSPERAPIPSQIASMQSVGRAYARKQTLSPSPISSSSASPMPSPLAVKRRHASPLATRHAATAWKRDRLRLALHPAQPAMPRQDFLVKEQLRNLQGACINLSRQISGIGEHGEGERKYAHAKQALDRLSRALSKHMERLPKSGGAIDQGTKGGMIAVDLDEAIHGLYTALAYLLKAGKQNAIDNSLMREASQWASDPMTWLTNAGMSHGTADIALTTLVSVALAPFALMALHAGIGELTDSIRHGKALEAELIQTRTFLESLGSVLQSARMQSEDAPPVSDSVRHMLAASQAAYEQREADLVRAERKNRENGYIGACSALSGGAIASKATLEVTAKIAYAAAASAPAATVAGTLGTMVLGPLAATGAVGLAAVMVRKSNQAKSFFNTAFKQTVRRLALLVPRSHPKERINIYKQFLHTKLDQRKTFFHRYARDNRRFLVGCLLYAGSTLGTAGLTAAALLGAGVAIGPLGLGLLIGVGVIGGLVMGRYSFQFLQGHGRQHRYENYAIGDDPELDRHFLSTLEASVHRRLPLNPAIGLSLRAGFYEQASKREEIRQDFLGRVATDLGRRYDGMYSYSTDSEKIRGKRNGPPTAGKTIRNMALKRYEGAIGRWRAGKSYLGVLLRTQRRDKAKAAAQDSLRTARRHLNIDSLYDWLQELGNYPEQIKMMRDSLGAQTAYLQEKMDTRLAIYALSNDISLEMLSRDLTPDRPSPPATVTTLR
jgi:hypothetical protein